MHYCHGKINHLNQKQYRIYYPPFRFCFLSYLMVNTVPDQYASTKVAFLHPSKLHVSKISNMSKNIIDHCLKRVLTTFVIDVSLLSGEIFAFKIYKFP